MLFYEISVLLGQPNFNRPGKIGSEYIRRVTSEKDIHVHPRFALKEMGQPIYDFAIIKANEPFWHMQKSVHNRMIPVCLLEYIRKHAVRLLRLREQHTPPHSVIVIVVSLQLMHFLIHTSRGKSNII